MSATVPRLESLRMAGPAGALEGILRVPQGRLAGAGLLCHPHPLFGGSMHSPVIFRAARALHRRGFATLRFNFRSVGRSEGEHDDGRGERDDARVALETLAGRLPGAPITLVGYSFGARVGLEAAGGDPRVHRLVAIGLPLTLGPFDFLRSFGKPLLLIQGEADELGPVPALERLAEEIGPAARLVVVPRADHLFSGALAALEESLFQSLAEA